MIDKYLRYLPAATVDVLREYGEQWARLAVSANPADTELAYMTSYRLLGKHALFCLYTLPAVMGVVPYVKQWNSRPKCVRYLNDKYRAYVIADIAARRNIGLRIVSSKHVMVVDNIVHYEDEMQYEYDPIAFLPDTLYFDCKHYTRHIMSIRTDNSIDIQQHHVLLMQYEYFTDNTAKMPDKPAQMVIHYDDLAHFNRSKAYVADNVLDYVWNTTGRIHSL